jgi:hypothetical protein
LTTIRPKSRLAEPEIASSAPQNGIFRAAASPARAGHAKIRRFFEGANCPSPGAAFPSGSLSRAQRQTALPPRGNSDLRQSPPEVENANPSKAGAPSMPASFTSMDSESEITPGGNPPAIQSGRKPL